jgi:hypothetical protein
VAFEVEGGPCTEASHSGSGATIRQKDDAASNGAGSFAIFSSGARTCPSPRSSQDASIVVVLTLS